MKSIEEFATEYAQDKYLPVQTSQAVKEGANYVLDEIERIVNSAIENKSIAIPTWRLNYIIKQLKNKVMKANELSYKDLMVGDWVKPNMVEDI